MTFAKRLRFFGIGLSLGVLLSLAMFGPERFSCSGYLPESRVLAELETKKWSIALEAQEPLRVLGIDSVNVKQNLLPNAKINFEESEARLKPCGKYAIYYPKDSHFIKLFVLKCDSTAQIIQANQLQRRNSE